MFVNNYSKNPPKNGTGAATTFQRHAVPLQKAAKKGMLSTQNNSSESGSMYLDKSTHISLGKNLKSYRYTQMKPVWKAEWDLHGRRKEAAYENSRLASHEGRQDKSTCASQQRAHKLKNIGTHLVSKSTLGGGPSRLRRPLSRKNTSAVNASTLLPRKTKPSLLQHKTKSSRPKPPPTKPLTIKQAHDHSNGEQSCPICQNWSKKAEFFSQQVQRHADLYKSAKREPRPELLETFQ